MEILFLIGRVIFGGYFIYNGINHFKNNVALTGYAASKGVLFPKYAVYLSGVLILLGGIGIVLGAYVKYAIVALCLFLIPVTFMMHQYWKATDPMQKSFEFVNFTKNLALLGAALMTLAVLEPWSFSFSF